MTRQKNASGRRPADQAGAGRQDMWMAIKASPDRILVTDIVARTGVNLDVISAPVGHAASWTLVRDIGHHAPRVRRDGSPVTLGEVTAQIWLAMCGLKDFDFRDLMQNASIEIPEATARDYCKRLLAAGYLRVLTKADPHQGRIARYRLIRSSGPRAPQVQRVRQVYDPNTGDVYPLEGQS